MGNRGRVEIPGRLNIPGNRVDEIRGSGAGVDDGVYLLDGRDEGEERGGSSSRNQQSGGWGWNRDSEDEN